MSGESKNGSPTCSKEIEEGREENGGGKGGKGPRRGDSWQSVQASAGLGYQRISCGSL